MTTEGQLWAMARGYFPVTPLHDDNAVHRLYGPAFGPWVPLTVLDEDGKRVVSLARGGATETLVNLRQVANDWRKIAEFTNQGDDRIPPIPDPLTVLDVAMDAPHGFLVARGFARLWGVERHGETIPGDLEMT